MKGPDDLTRSEQRLMYMLFLAILLLAMFVRDLFSFWPGILAGFAFLMVAYMGAVAWAFRPPKARQDEAGPGHSSPVTETDTSS